MVRYARENLYIVKTLKEFQLIDEDGKDQGSNGMFIYLKVFLKKPWMIGLQKVLDTNNSFNKNFTKNSSPPKGEGYHGTSFGRGATQRGEKISIGHA